MSNNYRPHVHILPEDEANQEMAKGFLLPLAVNARSIKVLQFARGWEDVIREFEEIHVKALRQFPDRFMILVIDFDSRNDRFAKVQSAIPEDLRERVFVIGVWSNPEALRTAKGLKFEDIGKMLADECESGNHSLWQHDLLTHNATEVARMSTHLKSIVFK